MARSRAHEPITMLNLTFSLYLPAPLPPRQVGFASHQRFIHYRCKVSSPGLLEIHTDNMSLHHDTEPIGFKQIYQRIDCSDTPGATAESQTHLKPSIAGECNTSLGRLVRPVNHIRNVVNNEGKVRGVECCREDDLVAAVSPEANVKPGHELP